MANLLVLQVRPACLKIRSHLSAQQTHHHYPNALPRRLSLALVAQRQGESWDVSEHRSPLTDTKPTAAKGSAAPLRVIKARCPTVPLTPLWSRPLPRMPSSGLLSSVGAGDRCTVLSSHMARELDCLAPLKAIVRTGQASPLYTVSQSGSSSGSWVVELARCVSPT